MTVSPTLEEVRELAATGRYDVLPVSCEILSDFTTPIETMKILKNVSSHCYMLESASADEKWGRYTFLGFDPTQAITCIGGTMNGVLDAGKQKYVTGDPSAYLRQVLSKYRSPRFAWELLLSVFRWQDDYGMLPDMLYDSYQSFGGTKPPFHGVALEFLLEYTDFSFAPRAGLVTLYEGLSKWVFWWLSWRDTDLDGIVQYDTADESGFDDISFFQKGGPVAAPDLAAYLILAMDHLADLAGRLGRTYEAREWKRRAQEMLEKAVPYLFNGKTFDARIAKTGEWAESETLIGFVPLLLGRRLPKEIRETLAAALSKEGEWLTPWGLAGERLGSAHCRETGWSAGPILAPAQLLVILGLHFSGEDALAGEIARRYCRALIAENFPMVLNPKTGKDASEGRWGARYPNRMPWTAVVFLILGSMYL